MDYLAARYVIGARVKAAQGIMRVRLIACPPEAILPSSWGCRAWLPESTTSGSGWASRYLRRWPPIC